MLIWDSLTVHHWQPGLRSIKATLEDPRYMLDVVPIVQLEREDVAEIALWSNSLEVGQLRDLWKGAHDPCL